MLRAIRLGPAAFLAALLVGLVWGDTIRLVPKTTAARMISIATPPKITASKMDRPGPVRSPDPYFMLKIGDAEVYRDAKDATLAYYRPIIRLAARTGTPLAEGVGELASKLDGFRFRYYNFESGGSPKWASIQVVVSAEKPPGVTLEAVRQSWPEVRRLVPVPFTIQSGPSAGVRMILPYPSRKVTFTELQGTDGSDEFRWYYLSTNTKPTPPDLLTNEDNNALNEAKAKDFASLLTSDLSDLPSFQPVLEVRAVYPGWSGASPIFRRLDPRLMKPQLEIAPKSSQVSRPQNVTAERRVVAQPILRTNPSTAADLSAARSRRPISAGRTTATIEPVKTMPTFDRTAMRFRPDLVRVFGTLKPREDVDYSYSNEQQLITRIPVSYSKSKTPNYDYYFLSDSGRFGGPYFEPSSAPQRPQLAQAPVGLPVTWYESHSFGRRLVWPAPKEMRLCWEAESDLRPSCRFSLAGGADGKMTAHITYDLYPDFPLRPLIGAVEELAKRTGETIDLLPFPEILDANRIAFASGDPVLSEMVSSKQVWVTKLNPQSFGDAWLRLGADIPIADWSTFTRFMKLGDLGTWDFGVITGATSGTAEKVSFRLTGDLLQTMGGPVAALKKSFDAATGGFEVSLENFGIVPLAVRGLRFVLTGTEQAERDFWFESKDVLLPAVSSASSFDQSEGSGGSVGVTVSEAGCADLKALWDSGKYREIGVQLTPEMIGPPAGAQGAGGLDPDVLFSFLRSLCYQYVGSSQVARVPVVPAEASQWLDYGSGTVVLRYQGFVYTQALDLSLPARNERNEVGIRQVPREGAYAFIGKPGDKDVVEYRAWFAPKSGGAIVYLPARPSKPGEEWGWETADTTMVMLNMMGAGAGSTPATPDKPAEPVDDGS